MRSLVPVNRLRTLDALSDLTRQMERLFDEMNASWSGLLASTGGTWIPPMDIVETDNEIRCTIEVPGVPSENLQVAVQDGLLRISGTKSAEHEEGDEKSFRRIERRFGRFERYIRLPERVDIEKITANYENGVLTLVMPKRDSARPRQIPIQSSAKTN